MAAEAMTRGGLPRVQWGPVITGVLCAIAVQIVLGLFGVAFGFAAVPAGKGLGIAAGIWTIVVVPIVASFIGAWVAVRCAGDRSEAGPYLHGALVWCIGLIAGALFITGAMASGEMAAGTAMSGNAPTGTFMRQAQSPNGRARAQATTEDAAKGAATGSGAAAIGALLGLGGALLGAGVGRRMLTGEGLRRGHAVQREHRELESGYPGNGGTIRREDTGVAYADRGTVTTRPPEGTIPRSPDDPTLHH